MNGDAAMLPTQISLGGYFLYARFVEKGNKSKTKNLNSHPALFVPRLNPDRQSQKPDEN